MDDFSSLPGWANLSIAGGFLAILFTGLWRGWIWTKPSVDELKSQHKLAIEDKDRQIKEWREAFYNADARNDRQSEYLRELVEVGKTSNAALSALPRPPVAGRS